MGLGRRSGSRVEGGWGRGRTDRRTLGAAAPAAAAVFIDQCWRAGDAHPSAWLGVK